MRRREFITLVGSAAAVWPMAARAQTPKMPVVGWLSGRSASESVDTLAAFRQGLSGAGFAEGQNVTIEYRFADVQFDRFPALAADLVRLHVAVIVSPGNTIATLAAKRATMTIPIVFSTSGNPVEQGLIATLSRPGGNLTGVTTLGIELGPKRLELLHELLPAATKIALLVNPAGVSFEGITRDMQAAARTLGVSIDVLQSSTEAEFEAAFSTASQRGASGLVIGADGLFTTYGKQLGALSIRYLLPTIYQYPEFAASGGLVSYGGSFIDGIRNLGIYTGRILKGEKPADLPVQQSTKVELIINLKTAKALGITVPLPILGRADEVIE